MWKLTIIMYCSYTKIIISTRIDTLKQQITITVVPAINRSYVVPPVIQFVHLLMLANGQWLDGIFDKMTTNTIEYLCHRVCSSCLL
jgi:hypothetical protein